MGSSKSSAATTSCPLGVSAGTQTKGLLMPGPGGKHNTEADETSQNAVAVRNSKVVTEKWGISTGSSRSSVSSSCNSSSFSSLDDTKSGRRSSFRQDSSAEVLIARDPTLRESNGLDQSGKQPRTTHIDVRGITVKSGKKEDSPALTYIDSPRPMQKPSKSAKPRFYGLQESLGVIHDFRKHRTFTDSIEHSRMDSPRHSYDGRESRDVLKSNVRLKELARHSLDSKRGSMIRSPQTPHNKLTVDSPRGSRRRQSSVVAKLMGLEPLPDSLPGAKELDSIALRETFDFSRSSRTSRGSLRSSHHREVITQQVNHANFAKKPTPVSTFPVEQAAPWKKLEGNRSAEAPQRNDRSVYGEIEKRLAQLEFKKSGKDLHALKQILESMQKSREKIGTPKKVGNSTISPRTCTNNRGHNQRPDLAAVVGNINSGSPSSPTARRTSSPETLPVSILNMKPDTRKAKNGSRMEERINLRNGSGRTVPMEKNVTCRDRDASKDAVSLRLQKKNYSSSDCSQRRTSQLGWQKRNSGAQDRKQKSRIDCLHLGRHDQGSELSGDSILGELSDRNNSVSLRSESNTSISSVEEQPEVTSTYGGDNWTGKKAPAPPREDIKIGKPQTSTAEQPSPISVLDATLYGDESPSPVKMIPNAFEGTGELNSSESQWDQEDPKSSSISKEPTFGSDIARMVLTKLLPLQYDTGINCTDPDHRYIWEILSVSGLMQDLDYGSVNFQLDPARHLFTRKLFLALEQIKASDRLSNGIQENPLLKCTDNLQRRLLFDAVNEILDKKFVFQHSNFWLGKRKNNQHQLLHGLCSEIDQLQARSLSCSSDEKDDSLRHIIEKDLSNQSVVWTDGLSDISGAVLDIERLIFKDLVSEVALGHVLRVRHASHCRQLF